MASATGRAMAVAGLVVAMGCTMGCAPGSGTDPMSRPAGPTPLARPVPDARLLPDQVAGQAADQVANAGDGTAPTGGPVGATRPRDTTDPADGDRPGDGALVADGRGDAGAGGTILLTAELCLRLGDALCDRLRAAGVEAGTVILLPGDTPPDDVDDVVRRLAELARQPQRLAETVGPAVLEQRLTPPTPPVEERDPEPDPAQDRPPFR